MSLLSFSKDWWLEVFSPKRSSESSRSLLNFDIERSMAIMGVSTLNQVKTLRYYKIYDLIIHFIHWIKYIMLYIVSNSHYWVTLGDFTITFGKYRNWALNLYFFSYTAISGVWYRFELFPATEQYYLWLRLYNQSVSPNEAKKPEWIQLKRRVNLVWTLLQYSLIYGTALPHFALIVIPSIYATNGWQMIISLIFCLIAMQRLLFLCKAIENILFLFITFMMILDHKLKTWRSLNEGQFNETDWVNYLKNFMSINHTYQSGNRVLSRIGGLFYAQTFITAIINMYIVFFITVPLGVKIMTIVSLTVALSMVTLPPIFCHTANQSNKLIQKVLMEAAVMDEGSISLRFKAQSMMEFNKRYPIGITFFDITQFDTKLFINTLLEMSSYMFLLVIQTRRQERSNING